MLLALKVSGSLNSADVNVASGNNTFHYYKMSIKQEYARVIDSFFDMFGYKVNLVKIPNIHKRVNWDYIKCIDVNLEGNIPENYQAVLTEYDTYNKEGGNSYVHEKVDDYIKWYGKQKRR